MKQIGPNVFANYFNIFRCAPAWEYKEHIVYTLYWLVFGFLLPTLIIMFSSFKTIRCLRKVK